jgi:hypothetical protein
VAYHGSDVWTTNRPRDQNKPQVCVCARHILVKSHQETAHRFMVSAAASLGCFFRASMLEDTLAIAIGLPQLAQSHTILQVPSGLANCGWASTYLLV